MKNNQYRCAVCKGLFVKGWSDEEAESEYADNFPGETLEEAELVCDDCYQTITHD